MEAVQVVDVPERRRYEVVAGNKVAGYVTYERHSECVVFIHTRIKVAFEGRGLGSVLARGALDDVRARGLRVVALCPFIASWIERNPDYDDLVDHDLGEQLRASA